LAGPGSAAPAQATERRAGIDLVAATVDELLGTLNGRNFRVFPPCHLRSRSCGEHQSDARTGGAQFRADRHGRCRPHPARHRANGGEAFVPSFGALGIGGAVAFAIGSLLTFDTPGYRLAWPVVAGTTSRLAGGRPHRPPASVLTSLIRARLAGRTSGCRGITLGS